jgi:hypothetical protein
VQFIDTTEAFLRLRFSPQGRKDHVILISPQSRKLRGFLF